MERKSKINVLVKVSTLGALAFIVMFLEFPLIALFPEFLKIDLSDFPALLAGFSMGPVAGVLVMLVKNLLHLLFKSGTQGIGELGNFIVGAAMVYTAAIVYKNNKTMKGAVLGLIAGTIAMALAGAVANYFVLLPLYEKVLGFPMSAIIAMGQGVNTFTQANIDGLWSFVLIAIVPFNLLKGVIVSVVTLLLYKRVSPILHK